MGSRAKDRREHNAWVSLDYVVLPLPRSSKQGETLRSKERWKPSKSRAMESKTSASNHYRGTRRWPNREREETSQGRVHRCLSCPVLNLRTYTVYGWGACLPMVRNERKEIGVPVYVRVYVCWLAERTCEVALHWRTVSSVPTRCMITDFLSGCDVGIWVLCTLPAAAPFFHPVGVRFGLGWLMQVIQYLHTSRRGTRLGNQAREPLRSHIMKGPHPWSVCRDM